MKLLIMRSIKKMFALLLYAVFSTVIVFGQAVPADMTEQEMLQLRERLEKERLHKHDGDPDASPGAILPGRELYDLLFFFPHWDATGEYPVATDGNYIYTARWNSTEFYRYEMDGTYVSTFFIPGAGNLRDLTYDGTYFYASPNSSVIYELCLDTESLISTFVTPATSTVRAIAYDGEHDGFWVSNGWNPPLTRIDRTGAVQQTLSTTAGSLAGLGWDNYSEGAPFLWIYGQPLYGSRNILKKINISTGAVIETYDVQNSGVPFDPASIAGGMDITDKAEIGKWAFLGAAQNDLVWCIELTDAAPVESPGAPTDLEIIPGEEGAFYADLSWVNPDVTVGGDPLTELDWIHIYRDEDLIESIENPDIGEPETFHDDDFPDTGLYTYHIVGENAAGEGLPAIGQVWIGEDVPAAPGDVTLEAVGVDGLITWDAPTEGLHGGYFTGLDLTYTVIRFPDNVEVATNIPETSFLDDDIPGIGTYYYTVTSYNAIGEGGTAESNEATLGPPYSLPFEEDFTGVPVGQLPEGWESSIDNVWNVQNTSSAGGVPPEVRLTFSPSYVGYDYLATPPINTSIAKELTLEFKHFLSHFSGPYTLKVVTYVDGNEYVINQWMNPAGWGSITETFTLTAEDHGVGSTHLQIRWIHDGDTWNMNNWNKDDISLEVSIYADFYTVTFNIEDEEGDPIENAVITLGGVTYDPGEYVIDSVLAGTYEYTVEKEGFFTVEDEVEVEEDITVDVVMIKAWTVTFEVEDEHGEPITDAIVTFDGETYDPGHYIIYPVATGTYEYTVEREGYFDVEGEVEVEEDVTVVVVMEAGEYELILIADPEEGGTVEGEGWYEFNEEADITATPNEGWEFIEWTGDIEHVDDPGSAETTVTMPAETVTLTAHFELKDYLLILEVDPEGAGTVTKDPDLFFYNMGDEIVITATPEDGWFFVNWTDHDDNVVSIEPDFTYTMPALDVTLTANFTDTQPLYNLVLEVNPENAGTVDGAGEYEAGEEATVTATANEGWMFLEWTDEDGETVSEEESFDYTMPAEDVTLTANFETLPSYTLTLTADPADAGTVEGDGEYEAGETVQIAATPVDVDWEFENWSGDTEYVEDPQSATTIVTMPEKNIALTANFEFVSVEEIEAAGINIFPNPARDKFYVESNEMIKQIRVMDISGQVIKEIAVDALNAEINVNNFNAGVYFLQFYTTESLITKTVKVVR